MNGSGPGILDLMIKHELMIKELYEYICSKVSESRRVLERSCERRTAACGFIDQSAGYPDYGNLAVTGQKTDASGNKHVHRLFRSSNGKNDPGTLLFVACAFCGKRY